MPTPPISYDDDDTMLRSPICFSAMNCRDPEIFGKMTSFPPASLESIWEHVNGEILSVLWTGREKRKEMGSKDQFFKSICVLKHGGIWQFNAAMFKRNCSMVEQLLTRFIKTAAFILYKTFFLGIADVVDMKFFKENDRTFTHHVFAPYATDNLFQKFNYP